MSAPVPKISGDFGEWGAILEQLDPFKASMLEEAQVGISGNTIVISGGEVLQIFFDNPDNIAAIERAARAVTGRDCKAVFDRVEQVGTTPQGNQEQPAQISKINQFLSDVKTSGIEIKVQ
jgi:hypothetical protein